ncbi:MAG: metallophosphoesterase [Candidatus Saccharimonadales bacterium]
MTMSIEDIDASHEDAAAINQSVTETNEQSRRLSFGAKQARLAGKFALGAAVGLLGASQAVQHETFDGRIGPHRAEMQVNFDGHATLDMGPAGALRMPLDTPLGIGFNAEVKETSATGKQLLDQYIELLQHPDGEVAYLQDAVTSAIEKNVVGGIMGGEALVFAAAAGIGFYRRNKEQFAMGKRGKTLGAVIALGAATGASTAALNDTVSYTPDAWESLASSVPRDDIKLFPKEIQTVEIRGSGLKAGITAGWPLVKEKFITSKTYYESMLQAFEDQSYRIPKKENEEIRILVVSDRHDNVSMDALIKSAIQVAKPDILIDAGDDTSSGEAAESFSINSLLDATKSVKNRLVVLGNHDSSYTNKQLVKGGFTSLDSEKPVTVAGIRFIGGADPRHSDLGMAIRHGEQTIPELGTILADAACSDEAGIDIAVTHDPRALDEVAARGCVDMTISGHMHAQFGPELQNNADGTAVYRFTNGTTGGAQEAIAIGPLSNPADITILSYKIGPDKQAYPYGWQQLRFNQNGSVNVKDFEFAGQVTGIREAPLLTQKKEAVTLRNLPVNP